MGSIKINEGFSHTIVRTNKIKTLRIAQTKIII